MMKWRGVNISFRFFRFFYVISIIFRFFYRGISFYISYFINRFISYYISRFISRFISRIINGRGKIAEIDIRKRRGRGKVGRRGLWEGEDML